MGHAAEVYSRRIARSLAAGKQWEQLGERRLETLRKLQVGGPMFADDPKRVRKYIEREARKSIAYAAAGVTESSFAERRIGPTLDLDEIPPDDTARTAANPVGRIVELDAQGKAREGFATGFLVTPRLLLTNWHVFASAGECANCGVQFGYEKVAGVLTEGTVFEFETDRFFYADEALDFAFVAVAAKSTSGIRLSTFGCLPLVAMVGKILVDHPISIIQHPDGGPKKFGVRNNKLLVAPTDEDLFLHYSTDTLPGSSGSPALNKDWEVVALHHSGVPEIRDGRIMTLKKEPWVKGMPDSDINWIANEGARVSCICAAIERTTVAPTHQALHAELIASFGDNLSQLPGIMSHHPETRNAELALVPDGKPTGAVSITVNGTANFYFGPSASLPATDVPIQPPAQAGPVILPSAVEKRIRFDPDYDSRPGYLENFLAIEVPLPTVVDARQDELLTEAGEPLLLRYHHYSVVMNELRRLQMWSAVNVDYRKSKRRKSRKEWGTDKWIPDPRIAAKFQIADAELYNPAALFDRGHIVRRDDTAWGDTSKEEEFANSDSFHFTNCTPQHERFNRDVGAYDGIWGGLENHIATQAKNVGYRMTIFAGPILDNENDVRHDFGGGEVLVPTRFWKVLIVAENHDSTPSLRAYGFILDQTEAIEEWGLERFSAGAFATYQKPLHEISTESGVEFSQALLDADALPPEATESSRRKVTSFSDVVL